nr:MAG TPA: tail tape measure protein [Caudoviricetes sp.]
MANDGTIEFDSEINTDNLERDLSEMEEAISDAASAAEKKAEAAFENMEKQAKRLAKAYEDAGMDASEAMQKAWKDVQANADAFGTNASENFRNVGAAAEDAGASIEGLSEKLQNALAAAGLAYGAKEITEVGISYEKAMNQVEMSTGAAGQELENLQGIASNVYADNFGESMEDAAASVAEVYKRTGLVGEELQKATEGAYTLQNAFGYEVNDSLQAATQLMNTFGISAEEAYTLIAQGAQKGLDQNGDMLDTLNEYSVQFANLGYSAEDMFNMLANGVQNGTWSVDKLGDAVKEMNIRLNDGTADEALQALGLGFAESATNAATLKQAALDVSKADVELQKAQQNVNDTLAKSGSASTEYQEALNRAEQAQINLEKAQAAYNKTSSETTYNLDEIKGKLAAGGSEAQEAIQEIMTALSQVENEQDRYVLGQTLMGTQWEDIGESAVQALMNTQGEISTTSDAMDKLADTNDLGDQLEKLKRQIETEVVVPVAQKYMPKIEKAIDYISGHLDEIVEHAKPIAAAIAAAFAVKKITDFGNSAVTTAKTIKTAFKALNASNPLGWIAIGVSALVGLETALQSVSSKHQAYLQGITDKAAEIPAELQKSIDATNEFADSWDNIKKNMDSNFTTESFDYESVVKLKDSLGELINADGTIKAGAEQKVSDIIDQLNQYADTGLAVSDGVIQKNGEVVASYDQISSSIDKVIEKQHAQSLLSVAEQGYQEALGSQQQLLDNEMEYAKSLEDSQGKLDSLQKKLDDIYKKHTTGTDINGNIFVDASVAGEVNKLKAEIDGYNQKIDETTEARAKNNAELETSLAYISRYKGMQEDLLNEDFDKVGEEFAKLSSDFVTASTGTREELKQQVSDFQSQYETLLETQKKSPELVSDEQLQNALYLWNQAIVEAEASTGEHATKIGTNFVDTIAAAGMSHDDQITALNTYIQNRLNDGESLKKIADSLGINFTSDMAAGAEKGGSALEEAEKSIINSAMTNVQNDMYSTCSDTGYYLGLGIADGIDAAAIAIATSAINGVTAAIDAAKAAGAIYSPSHIMRDEVGYMLGLGTAAGLQKSTPAVQDASKNSVTAAVNAATDVLPNVGVTAEIAQALVPQTLGIMSNQGSSAVSAYNPAYQQIQTADMQQQTAPAQNNQGIRDIIIPVSIGDETLETVVVNAVTRANASSGGWSV